jgi:RNA polymerase sigma-70 factor (ECF subfamily)
MSVTSALDQDPLRTAPSAADAHSPLSDVEVIARVLGGESALFELIMRRHNQRLFRVCRAILRDDAEAEDAVQQVYLSAYTKLDQFAGTAALSTWLTRIAIHESIARSRRRRRRAELEAEELTMNDLAAAGATPEDAAAGVELRRTLESAIDQLPEAYRVVFVMREVQQLDVAETAASMDISEENVKVRLHRAKAMLRERLYERAERGASGAYPFLGARCDRIVARVLAALPQRASK